MDDLDAALARARDASRRSMVLATMTSTSSRASLLFGVGERVCALPVAQVCEVMRALPVDSIADVPGVCGLAVIRGAATPVVAPGSLFGDPDPRLTRFIVVRAGGRAAALAVDSVLGVFELECEADLPRLTEHAAAGRLEAIAVRDADFVYVLNSASIVPEEAWKTLRTAER